jgi:hypothetical protein
MIRERERINNRPQPFEFYAAGDLWADENISKMMFTIPSAFMDPKWYIDDSN